MPGRMLRLLSLLQSRREWPGRELAQRLGVTDRTVRRDIERLRELGYPVDASTGVAGGYRLGSGRDLPPLLLDDDEAVAIAIGLRTAVNASVAGIEDTAVRAMAKLEQVLPSRLRDRVGTFEATIVPTLYRGAVPADPEVLAVLASACRDHEIVVFDYRGRSGVAGSRRVEPHSLVSTYGRWFLLGYDLHRDDWRNFRLDRLVGPVPVRHRFTPRPLPSASAAAYLAASITEAPYRYRGTATVQAPAATVTAWLPAPLPGKVEPLDDRSCTVRLGADRIDQIAMDLVTLDAEYTLEAPREVREAIAAVAKRLLDVSGTSEERPRARR